MTHDEIIGYQFVSLGKFTDFVKTGDTPNEAWEKAKGQYGRVADAAKIIDPRKTNHIVVNGLYRQQYFQEDN